MNGKVDAEEVVVLYAVRKPDTRLSDLYIPDEAEENNGSLFSFWKVRNHQATALSTSFSRRAGSFSFMAILRP
jgi:hypothetical protein